MKQSYLLTILFGLYSMIGYAQKVAALEVELPVATNEVEVPISVNLDDITPIDASSLVLFVVNEKKKTEIPFQVGQHKPRTLYWLAKSENKKMLFELHKGKPTSFPAIDATKNDGVLSIHSGDKNLLNYNFKTVYPPTGIDSAFKRSAFIHPLWTPHGQVLTRIQAPDHYHHYGIWNPWTHVLFEGDTLDFWNLGSKKGTVRFSHFASIENGSVYAEYAAHHEHVAFKKNGKEKVALNEIQTVRVYRPENNADYYLVDVTIDLSCASNSPFKILEYRYAGLGWRATEKWKKDNCEVLTSENKTRKDADGSLAKWYMVQGNLDTDFGGMAMLSYPSNYNHPEPLRIWPETSNGGEMFAMFAPTKNKDWLLTVGNNYVLKYRFLVFNGHFTKDKIESAWHYFATPAKVVVNK